MNHDMKLMMDHWPGLVGTRQDEEGNIYGLYPFMFTWAIMCDLNLDGYGHRFCYKTLHECLEAYLKWDPSMETEPEGYVARK